MKIGYLQFSPTFGDKAKNLKKIQDLIADTSADLLVLPEMCTTGYMIKNRKELASLAEPIPNGPTTRALIKVARKNNCCLIVGMPEMRAGKFFNSSIAVTGKGIIAKHQKTHLFLKEKLYFNPGENKPVVFKWRKVKVGLGVCYDYMFPEFWRSLALRGADVFCNAANFVFDYGFKLMRARSLENGVFSITCNRSGKERGQQFKGGSEIVDTRGSILRKARAREEVAVIEINPLKSRNKKWNKYNDLIKDRRPELYI